MVLLIFLPAMILEISNLQPALQAAQQKAVSRSTMGWEQSGQAAAAGFFAGFLFPAALVLASLAGLAGAPF